MDRIHFQLAVLLLLILSVANAHTSLEKKHFVSLDASTHANRTQIANFIHIDQIIEDTAYATINESDFTAIKTFAPELILYTHSFEYEIEYLKSAPNFPSKDDRYHTFDEMTAVLHELATKYPHIAKLHSIGKTIQGNDIWALQIATKENRESEYFVPGVAFVGSHHAREHLSTETPLYLARFILENYGSNTEIKKLVDNRDIYFIPMLNVDGAMHDISATRYLGWRKNRKLNPSGSYGVDLNRNYDWRWGQGGSSTRESSDVYMGPQPFSEPESIAIKNFIENKANIRVMVSFHTYSELVMYPWGGSKESIGGKDQEVFETMANKMAGWNGYRPMQSSELYVATGDTCDWAYGAHNVFCFTFELTPRYAWGLGGFYPGEKAIDPTFKANIRPTLYLIEYADDPYRVLQAK